LKRLPRHHDRGFLDLQHSVLQRVMNLYVNTASKVTGYARPPGPVVSPRISQTLQVLGWTATTEDRVLWMGFLSMWDFRYGDADDNRTSPYGTGWRSLVFSNVLEFSYLKAGLAFLILIIIPALLVGVAPSIILTYGHHKMRTLTSLGRNPTVFAFIVLAALIVVALWAGRRFLSISLENFWHLHYTLVFPIFVVLREILRAASERLPGMTYQQEQIHRRRRVATVCAAVLLGGAGLALAMSVEFSIGLKVVDAERVAPWAVVKAALGNAAMVFGFSTAAASAFWLWRELSMTEPVLDWPHPLEPAASTLRVAHLSDLHVVGERYGYRMETGTHGPQGNRCVLDALERLAAIHAARPLQRVLVTGDITDAGTRAEWAEFFDLIERFPELRSRMSFIPGNHDINVVDRTNTARPDLPWSVGKALRKLRFVFALDSIQGDRVYLVDPKSGSLGPSLTQYLRDGERPKLLRELADYGALRGRLEIAKVWEAMFPLVEPAMDEQGYGVILLDSNARSNLSLTNAIGLVSTRQLRALRSVLKSSKRSAWLILLHHQVVEYPMLGIRLTDRIGLALMNAADLMAAIQPHARRTLVLHGHRHVSWVGITGETVLCSAPSVTLGMEEYRGRFNIHEFTVSSACEIQMTASEHIKVGETIDRPPDLQQSESPAA
jgi:3',5'-cyclic AMP phosphodiesterase CpdA